jgi:Fur family ferric uptake transcriptional regulator
MSDLGAKTGRDLEIDEVRDALRAAGMRWTPQRRVILDILFKSLGGHVTGAELVDSVQRQDPEAPASTVYRTLDMLERLGYVCHSHGKDGREEFHVMPNEVHAHLVCDECGASWEIAPSELRGLTGTLAKNRAFTVNLSHLTVGGRCAACTQAAHSAN